MSRNDAKENNLGIHELSIDRSGSGLDLATSARQKKPAALYSTIEPEVIEKIRYEKYRDFGTLLETCDRHPEERVRYYCRDCLMGLCSEDVVEHAKHDFILADNKAAIQIRKTILLAEENIRGTT